MAQNVKAMNIDDIKEEAIQNSGLVKPKSEFTDEDKANLELYYKIEQGRGLHEGQAMLEREKYMKDNEKALEKESKAKRDAADKLQKESEEKQKEAIAKTTEKFVGIHKVLADYIESKKQDITFNIEKRLNGNCTYAIGKNASEMDQPSFIIEGQIFVDAKRYEGLYINAAFGYHSITNGLTDENIQKDISNFEEQLEEVYKELRRKQDEANGL